MYAYRRNLLTEEEIENLLVSRFKAICKMVNNNVHWYRRGIYKLHNEQNHFLVDFLTQCHDMYLMLAKHVDPQSKCIAQEIPGLLTTFIQEKITIDFYEQKGFDLLKGRTWWRILTEKLASSIQTLALDRGESGKRGIPLTKEDALIDSTCNAYGVMLKFCQDIVPTLANPTKQIKVIPAIGTEFEEGKSDAKKVAAVDNILQQLSEKIEKNYPNILLQSTQVEWPEPQKKLYMNFLPKMKIVGNVHSCTNLKLRFDYIPCKHHSKGTMVFISDLLHDRTEWSLVYPEFYDEYDVFIFDLPGVGLTTDVGHCFSVEEIVTHLHHLLLQLRITSPHIVGHGFGGCIAAELYKRYMTKYNKLILLNVPLFTLPENCVQAYEQLIKSLAVGLKDGANKEAFILTYIALFYVKSQQMHSVLTDKDIFLPDVNEEDLSHQLNAYIGYCSSSKAISLLQYLNSNNVLSINSSNDNLLGNEVCQVPVDISCMRVTLHDVGHGILDEAPKFVISSIKDHLGALSSGQPIKRAYTESNLHSPQKPKQQHRRSNSAIF